MGRLGAAGAFLAAGGAFLAGAAFLAAGAARFAVGADFLAAVAFLAGAAFLAAGAARFAVGADFLAGPSPSWSGPGWAASACSSGRTRWRFLAAEGFFGADVAAFFAAVTMISFNGSPPPGHGPQHAVVQEHSRHPTGG